MRLTDRGICSYSVHMLKPPDLYLDGVCVYRLDSNDHILEVAAWSTNTFVAMAAFNELVKLYPKERYSVRRRELEHACWPKEDR